MSIVNKATGVLQRERHRVFKQLPNDPTRGSSPGTIDQTPPPYNPVYPYNTVVHAGESGNLIEVDDTHQHERINVYHRTGSYICIHPDGKVQVYSASGAEQVTVGDHNVMVQGDLNITVDGGAKVLVRNGALEIEAQDSLAINVKGELKMHADNIKMSAQNKITLGAPFIDFGAPVPYMTLPAGVAMLMGVTVPQVLLPGVAAAAAIPSSGGGTSIAAIAATATSVSALVTQMNTFKGFAGNIQKGIDLVKTARDANGDPLMPEIEQPEEIPLANPKVYVSKAVKAVDLRTRVFDTPADVNDVETYAAHMSICEELGDFTPEVKQLPGQVLASDTTRPAPEPLPATAFAQTGTVTCTQGSDIVTGEGTAFTTDVAVGQSLIVAGHTVRIAAVRDDATLVLASPWVGPDTTGGYELYMLRPFAQYFNNYDYGFDAPLGVSTLVLRDLCGTANLTSVQQTSNTSLNRVTGQLNVSAQSNANTNVDIPAMPSGLVSGPTAGRYVRSTE